MLSGTSRYAELPGHPNILPPLGIWHFRQLTPMDGTFYYSTQASSNPIGPVSFAELRALAVNGAINGDTRVVREGANEWAYYRDFDSSARPREMADVVMDRAARVAAKLQTEESKSFTLGLLIGIVRFGTLPWDIVRVAVRTISEWGASRVVTIQSDRIASATLSKIVAPMTVLMWTVLWMGDCVAMLIVGRPSFTLTVVSMATGFFTMGIAIPTQIGITRSMVTAAAGAALTDALTVHDFGDRIAWVIKIALVGYFLTICLALMGEVFAGLAALIGRRVDARPPNGSRDV
jgi:GYF domain 2